MQNERHIGKKYYELTNHLGNVLAVVSDFKRGVDDFGYDNTGGFPSDYIYEAVPSANEWGIVKDVSYGSLRRNTTADGIYDYYEPDVVSYSDYYPFGALMPGRHSSSNYRSTFYFDSTKKCC